MRLRIISCVLSYAIIAAACTDVSGPNNTQRRYVGYPPGVSKNIPTITDWYQCSSTDDGESWDCYYERTDYGTPDYWSPDNSFHTTALCDLNQWAHYCDQYFQPEGSPYSQPRWLVRETPGLRDNDLVYPPTCPAKSNDEPVLKAWCAGHTPNTTQLTRIQAALSRMHQLGGICHTLASIGDAVLSHNTLRLFPQSEFKKGGWAPQNGGSTGPLSWVLITEDVVDRMYDAAHMGIKTDPNSGNSYPADLQTTLTHELDHLANHYHIRNPDGSENLALTENERACPDFQW
jgi:hypothetical protein